jgi:hypothetical protein
MNADDDLGAIFGNPKESGSSDDEGEEQAVVAPVKVVPVTAQSSGKSTVVAAPFDTPEPSSPKGAIHQLRKKALRGKSVSPKRKLHFGSDSEDEEKEEGESKKNKKKNAEAKPKRIAKRKRRGTSLPAGPVFTVTAPSDEEEEGNDDGEVPRRSPRKPPPTKRFDPAKAGAKKTRGRLTVKRGAYEEDDDEEEEQSSKKKTKTKPKAKQGEKRKKQSGKAQKKTKARSEEEDDGDGDSDEKDQDFGARGAQKKRRKASATASATSPKKKSPKKVLADENAIKVRTA